MVIWTQERWKFGAMKAFALSEGGSVGMVESYPGNRAPGLEREGTTLDEPRINRKGMRGKR